MDIFAFRDRLIENYSDYVQSFFTIRDERIMNEVDAQFKDGLLWPEVLIQLNPNFEPGGTIDELADKGTLHDTCRDVFRVGKTETSPKGKPMQLHWHQQQAIECAATGENYVLTTGTGSGKSLAYIVPIVDHILRNGSGKGIQAIIVYPMNALANSQLLELEKFVNFGFLGKPPLTFKRYTGQENEEQKDEIVHNPPDILLT
ncbi:MAG: DEAD/DEAH box helicase, partial [Verrucomicrobiae bacterium]|nr:DEAD/DEAH box helicase [Verrucomicrobiae bacterium]